MEKPKKTQTWQGFRPRCRKCGPAHWATEVLAGLASREMIRWFGNNRQECQQGGRRQQSAVPCSGFFVRLSGPHVTACIPCRGFAFHAEKAMERSSGAAELQRDSWGRLTRCPLTHKADTQPLPAISRRFFLLVMCFHCPLLRKLNTMLTLKEKWLKEFPCWSQGRYFTLHLDLRGNNSITHILSIFRAS